MSNTQKPELNFHPDYQAMLMSALRTSKRVHYVDRDPKRELKKLSDDESQAAREKFEARAEALKSAAPAPRLCNTGGQNNRVKNNQLNNQNVYNPEANATTIDWLRVTVRDYKSFRASLIQLTELLGDADITLKRRGFGLYFYEQSATLNIWKDNQNLVVGNVCHTPEGKNEGGLFELSGVACDLLQTHYPLLWVKLYELLTLFNWSITRVDVALDLEGEYATQQGLTLPMILDRTVKDNLFASDFQKNPNTKLSYEPRGDWTDFISRNLQPSDYNPLKHCPAGLTLYVGSRKHSDDFFRTYEKGKEILGRMPEPENIDRGWVRIEHEMTRKSSNRVIPLEVMLNPDEYFCAGRSGIRQILDDLRTYRELKHQKDWRRELFTKKKLLKLSAKIHHAKRSYGRLVRTLLSLGFEEGLIIEKLTREVGLGDKDFILDIVLNRDDSGQVTSYTPTPTGLDYYLNEAA